MIEGLKVELIELAAADTHALRRSLLRDGTTSDVVAFDGDDLPTTFHLGATIDGRLVTISTWMARPFAHLPHLSAHQLRGMATDPVARGSGVSAKVLRAGLARCAEAGSSVVWARARVAALSFYERHGFEQRGDEYIDETTAVPHRDIVVFV